MSQVHENIPTLSLWFIFPNVQIFDEVAFCGFGCTLSFLVNEIMEPFTGKHSLCFAPFACASSALIPKVATENDLDKT